jgi:Asp-tRNA(Asn)/Glu-tRNA(Gln) amidotransferase A subunit family amidase
MLRWRHLNAAVHGPRTSMTTIHDLTAHAQSCAYATNELSPVEVTRSALARIEAWDRHPK